MIADNGDLLGCAPPKLREFSITDTLPDDVEIVGATNEPNGWREGTGKLELLLRNKKGELNRRPITAGEVKDGLVCWSQSPPDNHYRTTVLPQATRTNTSNFVDRRTWVKHIPSGDNTRPNQELLRYFFSPSPFKIVT